MTNVGNITAETERVVLVGGDTDVVRDAASDTTNPTVIMMLKLRFFIFYSWHPVEVVPILVWCKRLRYRPKSYPRCRDLSRIT